MVLMKITNKSMIKSCAPTFRIGHYLKVRKIITSIRPKTVVSGRKTKRAARGHNIMRKFQINKRALSAPVGNLIILVAAVLLSTTVVLFATNVTSSQVQKETMFIPSSHVWYVNSTYSLAAIAVTDTGPTSIVIVNLQVKGVQCQWNGTDSYVIYSKINGTLPGDLPYADISNAQNNTINIGGQNFNFTTASAGLTLKSGDSIAFYVAIPNTITIYDLATPINVILTTTQSVYCTQTLVQTS